MFINNLNNVYEHIDVWKSYCDGFGIEFREDEISSFKIIIEVENSAERKKQCVCVLKSSKNWIMAVCRAGFGRTCSRGVCTPAVLWYTRWVRRSGDSCRHVPGGSGRLGLPVSLNGTTHKYDIYNMMSYSLSKRYGHYFFNLNNTFVVQSTNFPWDSDQRSAIAMPILSLCCL